MCTSLYALQCAHLWRCLREGAIEMTTIIVITMHCLMWAMCTSQQSKLESAPPTVNEAPLQRQQSLATSAPCPMSTPGAELADASGVVLQPERGHSVFSRCLQWLHLGHDGASVLAVVETCISQFLLQAHARVFGDLKHKKGTILGQSNFHQTI